MNVTLVQETAEAVCGALHRLDFQFLGEEMPTTWWTRGHEEGKKIRVDVTRSSIMDVVIVTVTYPNWSVPGIKKSGHITMQLDCGPEHSRADVQKGTTMMLHRVLEIFSDVLQGKGVAGPEAMKKWIDKPRQVAEQNPVRESAEEE